MSEWSKNQEKDFWNECTYHSKLIWNCFNPDLNKKPFKNTYVLIAGCGATPVLENSVASFIVNLDISTESLKKLKSQSPKSNLIAADLENLPFQSSSFNYAICMQVLHHTKLINSLNELKKALLKNGTLISIDINKRNAAGFILRLGFTLLSYILPTRTLYLRNPHECPLHVSELTNLLYTQGFKITTLTSYLFLSPLFLIPLVTFFPESEKSSTLYKIMEAFLKFDTKIGEATTFKRIGYNIVCISIKL